MYSSYARCIQFYKNGFQGPALFRDFIKKNTLFLPWPHNKCEKFAFRGKDLIWLNRLSRFVIPHVFLILFYLFLKGIFYLVAEEIIWFKYNSGKMSGVILLPVLNTFTKKPRNNSLVIARFCLSETSCPQEDNYPNSLCIKVNGKLFPLPVSIYIVGISNIPLERRAFKYENSLVL